MTTAPALPMTVRPGADARRRVRALAAAETRLLLRNRTAVVNSVLSPLLLVALVPLFGSGDAPLGQTLLVSATAFTLVFLTYYNLVVTYVARREALVLQRMRTGELTDGEVLAAASSTISAAPPTTATSGSTYSTGADHSPRAATPIVTRTSWPTVTSRVGTAVARSTSGPVSSPVRIRCSTSSSRRAT